MFVYFWVIIWTVYDHIWNHYYRVFQNTSFHAKIVVPFICVYVSKIPWSYIFRVAVFRNYCHVWNQLAWFCGTSKFIQSKKFWNLDQKCLFCVFLCFNFLKKRFLYLKSKFEFWKQIQVWIFEIVDFPAE